jgi:hypothetical protein
LNLSSRDRRCEFTGLLPPNALAGSPTAVCLRTPFESRQAGIVPGLAHEASVSCYRLARRRLVFFPMPGGRCCQPGGEPKKKLSIICVRRWNCTSSRRLPQTLRRCAKLRSRLARFRPLGFRKIRRRLESAGFEEVSRKGSHVKFARVFRVVPIP